MNLSRVPMVHLTNFTTRFLSEVHEPGGAFQYTAALPFKKLHCIWMNNDCLTLGDLRVKRPKL